MGGDSETVQEQTTQTSNVQDIDTTTTGLEDVEFGVVGGGDVSVVQQSIDPGLVDLSAETVDRAFDFGESGLENILDFGRAQTEAGQSATSSALGTLGKAITSVSDASRSDTTDTFRRIAVPAIIGISLVFIVIAYRKK